LKKKLTYRIIITLLLCFIQVAGIDMYAQNPTAQSDSLNIPKARLRRMGVKDGAPDSIVADSLAKINNENYKKISAPADIEKSVVVKDTLPPATPKKKWIPNPTRAVWLATIFPGAGQIYNHKYWKLPIIYGGFVGCAYALSWNNKYYKDYSKAYMDVMDSDPNTNSYMDFLPPNFDLTGREQWLKDTFKRKKDFYRRNRDLSIFAFIGVYLLSIIDAYVDAELSNFDISPDLGLRIEPAVINDNYGRKNSVGLQCSIKF